MSRESERLTKERKLHAWKQSNAAIQSYVSLRQKYSRNVHSSSIAWCLCIQTTYRQCPLSPSNPMSAKGKVHNQILGISICYMLDIGGVHLSLKALLLYQWHKFEVLTDHGVQNAFICLKQGRHPCSETFHGFRVFPTVPGALFLARLEGAGYILLIKMCRPFSLSSSSLFEHTEK